MRFAFEHLQAEDGGSVYLRLSTRPVEQPERTMTAALVAATLEGAYWLREPAPGCELALVGMGALMPEVLEAADQLRRPAGARRAGGDLGRSPACRLARRAGSARGRRGGAGDHRAAAGAAGAAMPRWSPCSTAIPATLAWLGSAVGAPGLSARRRPLRPVGRHSGPLSRPADRRRGDHRSRSARLPGRARLARGARTVTTSEPDALAGARPAVLSIQSQVAYGPCRQQRRDLAPAASGLRRHRGQYGAAGPSSGPRQLVRPQGRAGSGSRRSSKAWCERGALGRCGAMHQRLSRRSLR